MASIREGNQGVLVVVDVQVGVVQDAWDAPRIVGNIARAVQRARAQGVPVIWVQHSRAELVAASLVADLNIAITWLRYPGRRNGTALAEQLSFAAPAGVR